MMTVDFGSEVSVSFHGQNALVSKEYLLFSLEQQIALKGFIVNDQLSREDVGDFIYYQFLYFDGYVSRKVQIKVPKGDSESVRSMDLIRLRLSQKQLANLEKPKELFYEL